MKAQDAIRALLSVCGERTACFFTNGFISRIAFSIKDRPENFYMIGSMGLVSAVGLGAALNTGNKVVIFDADGSILMNMGVMPVIGYEAPPNLVHIVFDNRSYGSTGNQPSVSAIINFSTLARSAGYRHAFVFSRVKELKKGLKSIFGKIGPTFVHLNVEAYKRLPYSRVSVKPAQLSRRIFRVV